MISLARLRPIWPLVVLLGAGALLGGAHAFQTFGHMQPCVLCLRQREWHWAVVGAAIAGLALLRVRPNWARWVDLALALVLCGAAGMALYHVAVEQHWIVARCEADVRISDIQAFDVNAPLVAPTCDTPAWTMFGVSMAGYNALLSAALALASFVVALAPERKHG